MSQQERTRPQMRLSSAFIGSSTGTRYEILFVLMPPKMVNNAEYKVCGIQTTHGSSAILSVPLFGYAAYYASDATISRLLIIATLSTAFGIPYTHLFIRPLNSAFARMASASPQTLQGKEQETHELLRKWQIQAFVRVMLGAISWGAAVLALQAS